MPLSFLNKAFRHAPEPYFLQLRNWSRVQKLAMDIASAISGSANLAGFDLRQELTIMFGFFILPMLHAAALPVSFSEWSDGEDVDSCVYRNSGLYSLGYPYDLSP